jgi:hypothetical protein
MSLTLTRHTWTGLRWAPCPSLDAHGRSVLARWPGAAVEHVAGGAVHRRDGRIVAECRRRGGYPIWEEWIDEPEEGTTLNATQQQAAPAPAEPAAEPKSRLVQVTTRGTLRGFPLEITASLDVRRLAALVGFLEGIGVEPPRTAAAFELTPDGLPICPKHRVPMRERVKQGDRWHSHKVEGPGGEELFCKGYDAPDSPGWRVAVKP